ncbi:MAG: hypothetical protein Harvfovirus8_2 [Harvfovirus sp.]|uniref:2'-5' RNA ligase family protein n=1 Tax=Harvfovirus sp. TaxID=2487768 RepID=A0A3G5A3R1_9VIRU|nr:MAG: hypothetical protein Harvfovirus8_2 [Harvfovirus sp.]
MDVTTALALVIATENQEKIDQIRSKKDRAWPRWPPHINFLFPFVPLENFDDIMMRLSENLKGFSEFTIELNDVGYFKQGKNITYHLKPKDDTKIQQLAEIITKTLPEIKMKHEKFQPHVTLGQSSKGELDTIIAELKTWLGTGIRVKVDKISFLVRSRSDTTVPFSINRELAL